MRLEPEHRRLLLGVARRAIQETLHGDRHWLPEIPVETLKEKRASFVTLKRGAQLRGCIGSLEPLRPLLQDVAHNARAAAFHDPRFDPLSEAELPGLHIEISVLARPQSLPAHDRGELLSALVPGEDGLIVQEGTRRATFLPAVWQSLPNAEQFLAALWRKAGFAPQYWSTALEFFRYHSESFSDDPEMQSEQEPLP